MRTRMNNASRITRAIIRICLSVICSIALAFSLTPAYGSVVPSGSSGTQSDEPLSLHEGDKGLSSDGEYNGRQSYDDYAIQDIERLDLDGVQASQMLSLMDVDGSDIDGSSIKLKSTNEVRWIDRVDFPEEFMGDCMNFYRMLNEACDNDGRCDYLIEDKYVDPSLGAPNTNEFYSFKEGFTGLAVGGFTYQTDEERDVKKKALDECTMAVLAAFDRDHPEVFWLSGSTITLYSTTNPDKDGITTTKKFLLIGGYQNAINGYERPDIRNKSFVSEDAIKTGIESRESRIKELLDYAGIEYKGMPTEDDEMTVQESSASKTYTNAEVVRFFNKWLTHSNGYNTADSLTELSSSCPLAFECLSALAGRAGTVGPVCEGYSRAFKALCDASGIPCVLTDGVGNGEAHMWNYVQIEGGWYAVDVTWNDPGKGNVPISGNENENYLLAGSNSKRADSPNGSVFSESHIVQNRHFVNGLEFVNGPVLEEKGYNLGRPSSIVDEFDASASPSIDLSYLDRDISLAQISSIPDAVYTTYAITPVPAKVSMGNLALKLNRDYTLSYANNVQAGTAYVIVAGIGKYTGRKTIAFNIKKATVSVSSASVAGTCVYTGKALKPVPNVKVSNANLRQGIDYVVETSYSNNKNVGKASVSVVVRGIGSCDGAILRTLSFKIYPKSLSIKKLAAKKKSFVASWAKATSAWSTGYQLRYSTSSKFKSGVKTVTVKKVSTSQLTVKKLKSKKRYYVSMRVYKTVSGVKYYGAWGSTKSVRVK